MDRSNVLTLIRQAYVKDAIGQPIATEVPRNVYCNLRSVSRSEWATAGQMGLKAELVAEMFAPDYHGEQIAEITTPLASSESSHLLDLNGQQLLDSDRQLLREEGDEILGSTVRYGIYRTYLRDDETIELYLERKAGVTNGN